MFVYIYFCNLDFHFLAPNSGCNAMSWRKLPYNESRGARKSVFLLPLRVFSLKRSTVGAFKVPFRVLTPKTYDRRFQNFRRAPLSFLYGIPPGTTCKWLKRKKEKDRNSLLFLLGWISPRNHLTRLRRKQRNKSRRIKYMLTEIRHPSTITVIIVFFWTLWIINDFQSIFFKPWLKHCKQCYLLFSSQEFGEKQEIK